jgi:hypothetical protein
VMTSTRATSVLSKDNDVSCCDHMEIFGLDRIDGP